MHKTIIVVVVIIIIKAYGRCNHRHPTTKCVFCRSRTWYDFCIKWILGKNPTPDGIRTNDPPWSSRSQRVKQGQHVWLITASRNHIKAYRIVGQKLTFPVTIWETIAGSISAPIPFSFLKWGMEGKWRKRTDVVWIMYIVLTKYSYSAEPSTRYPQSHGGSSSSYLGVPFLVTMAFKSYFINELWYFVLAWYLKLITYLHIPSNAEMVKFLQGKGIKMKVTVSHFPLLEWLLHSFKLFPWLLPYN